MDGETQSQTRTVCKQSSWPSSPSTVNIPPLIHQLYDCLTMTIHLPEIVENVVNHCRPYWCQRCRLCHQHHQHLQHYDWDYWCYSYPHCAVPGLVWLSVVHWYYYLSQSVSSLSSFLFSFSFLMSTIYSFLSCLYLSASLDCLLLYLFTCSIRLYQSNQITCNYFCFVFFGTQSLVNCRWLRFNMNIEYWHYFRYRCWCLS